MTQQDSMGIWNHLRILRPRCETAVSLWDVVQTCSKHRFLWQLMGMGFHPFLQHFMCFHGGYLATRDPKFTRNPRATEGGSSVSLLALLCHGISPTCRGTQRLGELEQSPPSKMGLSESRELPKLAILLWRTSCEKPVDFGKPILSGHNQIARFQGTRRWLCGDVLTSPSSISQGLWWGPRTGEVRWLDLSDLCWGMGCRKNKNQVGKWWQTTGRHWPYTPFSENFGQNAWC